MANETKPAPDQNKDLDAMAFEIYKDRVSSGFAKRGAETEAVHAYKLAEAFLKVSKGISRGEIKHKDPDGIQLADAFAPNLHRLHPVNLVSAEKGDLGRVQEIQAWLSKNPTPEREPQDLVGRLNQAFRDLNWDMPAINTARALFPAYCRN